MRKLKSIDSIRSDSLTLNSSAPLIIVLPSACVAITAKIGISSIKLGTLLFSMLIDLNFLFLMKISLTHSPPSKFSESMSTSTPIDLIVLKNSNLVGLVSKFLIISSDWGSKDTAPAKKAAVEGSAGTLIFKGDNG